MAQLLKRLLIIALLVSFISSSSAQTAASTEEETSSDMQLSSNCDPNTGVCSVPKKDGKVTKEAVTDQEDTTEYEPSTGPARGICMPGTTVCIPPKPADVKPTNEAVTDEDAFDVEPSNICDPKTGDCPGNHPSNLDTDDASLVKSSEKENAAESDAAIICDPITKICNGADTINSSVVPEPANAKGHDLPKPDNPTNNIVCTPGTPNCGHGHPNPSRDEL